MPPTVPPPSPPSARSDPEAASLRRWRRVAHACLAMAAALWVLALLGPRHLQGVLGWHDDTWAMLRLMAESGLVGGLADWFAITALFRRPLGLPIPHTALVPRNRDRIADGIAAYIDGEFLAPAMLRGQIRRLDLLGRLGRLLESSQARRHAAELLLAALPRLLAPEHENGLKRLLGDALSRGADSLDLRPVLARTLEAAVTSPEMEGLIGDLSDQAIGLISARRDDIRQAVAARSKWWLPRSVDTSLADQVTEAVLGHLYDLRSPHSEAGRALRQWLAGLPARLAAPPGAPPGAPLGAPPGDPMAPPGQPDWGTRLAALARAALDARALGPLVRHTLDALRATWEAEAGDPAPAGGMAHTFATAVMDSLAQTLGEPARKAQLDAAIEEAALAAMPAWRQGIRDFVAGTLRAQDIALFTRRLESRVGRDLQYVRINGTVLGALIGAGLHGVALLLVR